MEQQIQFCTTTDGVRIAYATVGHGPPLVKAANWLNHLEFDWRSPIWRHLFEEFARDHFLVRYDERGNGLSDWNVENFSFEVLVRDLEAVVDAVGLERFALLGISQGASAAIAYAVRHPERVSHLILYGAYARGWAKRGSPPDEIERRQAYLTLTKLGWGQDHPAYRQLWTTLFLPDATLEQWHWFNDLQRVSASPENAFRILNEVGKIDVVDLLPQVKAPTLVLHCRDEAVAPFEEGRLIASLIPGARFVPLEGRNHLLIESEPAWEVFVAEVRHFLGGEDAVVKGFGQSTGGPARSAFSQNALLGRYQILSKLGAGGMGEVYLAQDTQLGRRVAIKLLPPETVSDENARKRLVREARAAATLDHPNICSVYEVGEADGRSFIAMQYVEGETLDLKLKRKLLELKESLTIATQVADALSEAHTHGIIHRDIKPSNIIITARGQAKVMDFGLAKLIQHSEVVQTEAETEALLSTPGTVIGTLPYMSPEQVHGEALDGRSDIFSFGVVLYEMLSGQQPFASKSSAATASAILTREPPPLARFSGDVPTELERIVSKALRKDPDERYQTAKDLLIDLRSLRDELEFQHRLERSTPPVSGRDESVAVSSPPAMSETAEQPATRTVVGVAETTRDIEKESSLKNLWQRASSRTGLIVIAAIVIVAFAGWFFWSRANVKWARAQLPRIEQLAQTQKFFEAYDLAIGAQKYLSDDPTITRLMPTISQTISVTTDPAGAQVYVKRFAPDESGKFPPRQLVGTTPINNLRVARGQYILYIEKDGYAKTERTVSGAIMHAGNLIVLPPPIRVEEKLITTDKMPDRVVFVPGADYRLVAWARPTDARVRLNDYFIDKYEVSNQDYKEFINAGGYLKKQFWKYAFIKDDKTLSWEEAMKEFKDRAGLPGPRSWSSQNFPEGKADYPVTDITWYEAAAFAAFKGKQLPTIFQWEKAARNGNLSALVNYMPWGVFYPGETLDYHANFNNNGTMPVNSSEFGMSPFGVYNMAGNVSEWCLNETSQGFVADGGAWGEPSYMFANYAAFPGFYSSNKVGFRCAFNFADATGDQGAMRIEFKKEIPVYTPSSDASFNNWLSYYRYNKTPLDPQIVEVKETAEWRREKIAFNGADGERAIAYLYLPKNFPRPLQVIHFVPASDVQNGLRSLPESMENYLAPFIKSGRAAFGVVIKGYIERLRPEGYTEPEPTTVEYREKIINWVTDLRRGLDYVETRNDLDASRIAFYGPSAGARIGLILAAVENRYASVLLQGAGLRKSYVPWIAEANPINFASHIRATKLMVHGRYDETLSLKTEAEPLYKLLPEPKRLVLYDGGHVAPFEFLVTTMNGWLDETLGPVKRE